MPLPQDALAFAKWHVEHDGAPGKLHIVRLGLTREQALAHDLLDTDGNAETDRLPVPVPDALVREFIESHLDQDIQRAVVQAEAGMRAEVVRQLGATLEDSEEIGSPDTGEDWSWARLD